MRNAIVGLVTGSLILTSGMTATSCNVPDPGDMDRLLEALAEVPAGVKQDLKKQASQQKALEALNKKSPTQEIGKLGCFFSGVASEDEFEFERLEAERPTVQDLIDCLKNGIQSLHRGGVQTHSVDQVDYSFCLRTIFRNAAFTEEKELNRRAASDDPWEHYLDGPGLIDLRGKTFICIEQSFEEFLPNAIYDDEGFPKEEIDFPRVPPHVPIPPEDIPDDWEISDRRLVDMLFRLEKAPPIIQAAIISIDIIAASEFAVFVGLVCLDASPGWGCASAPGLPGYDGSDIDAPSNPGGDK